MNASSGEPLAHGWTIENRCGAPDATIAEFLRPASQAAPPDLAARLGSCRVVLVRDLEDPDLSSRWTQAAGALEVQLPVEGSDPHDLALELLFCLGQAVWEWALPDERAAWLKLLQSEMDAGVSGEIDEDTLAEKQRLLSSRVLVRSPRRLERYAGVSFAATLAEYVHSLWHDVTIRTGPEHLPEPWLRRRFELFGRWFPPAR